MTKPSNILKYYLAGIEISEQLGYIHIKTCQPGVYFNEAQIDEVIKVLQNLKKECHT